MTTDQKGAIAETAIAHAAAKLGIGVSKPFSSPERYDLIFDLHPGLVRVQCKWATHADSVVFIRCHSCRRSGIGQVRRRYDEQDIDAIAAYCAALGRCYVVPSPSWRAKATYNSAWGLRATIRKRGFTGRTTSHSSL